MDPCTEFSKLRRTVQVRHAEKKFEVTPRTVQGLAHQNASLRQQEQDLRRMIQLIETYSCVQDFEARQVGFFLGCN